MRPWLLQLRLLAVSIALLGAGAPAGAEGHANAHGAPAKGKFLVASKQLGDPNFAETVVLLIDYGADGAAGVIINRPTDVMLAKALPDLKPLRTRRDVLYLGGPVAQRALLLLILAQQPPSHSQSIFGSVHITGSLNTLRRLLDENTSRDRWRAYAGYAGWGAGQLEREVQRGDWYIVPADAETIFKTPANEMWPRLIAKSAGQWAMRHPAGPLQMAYGLDQLTP